MGFALGDRLSHTPFCCGDQIQIWSWFFTSTSSQPKKSKMLISKVKLLQFNPLRNWGKGIPTSSSLLKACSNWWFDIPRHNFMDYMNVELAQHDPGSCSILQHVH